MIIKILFPSALSLRCHWLPIFDFISFSTWPFFSSWPQHFYSQGVFGGDYQLHVAHQTCTTSICSSRVQLKHDYNNVKRKLCTASCHTSSLQAHSFFEMTAECTYLSTMYIYVQKWSCATYVYVCKINIVQLYGWRIHTDKTWVVNYNQYHNYAQNKRELCAVSCCSM